LTDELVGGTLCRPPIGLQKAILFCRGVFIQPSRAAIAPKNIRRSRMETMNEDENRFRTETVGVDEVL